jgi:hypothetical protein
LNYKDKKNSELTENQLDFLTAFTEGVPLHVLYHWIRSNMHIYIKNNISNLAIEKIISVKTNGIAIEAFIPTTSHSENTFCSTYNKLYTFFILDEMKDKCVEGLEEFKSKQLNAEEKNLWLEKYKEYGAFVYFQFLANYVSDNRKSDQYYHLTIDNNRSVKISKVALEKQIKFGELFIELLTS